MGDFYQLNPVGYTSIIDDIINFEALKKDKRIQKYRIDGIKYASQLTKLELTIQMRATKVKFNSQPQSSLS